MRDDRLRLLSGYKLPDETKRRLHEAFTGLEIFEERYGTDEYFEVSKKAQIITDFRIHNAFEQHYHNLQWFHGLPAGVDHYLDADLAAKLKNNGIKVTSGKGVNAVALAEAIVCAILLKSTRLDLVLESQGNKHQMLNLDCKSLLHGKTVLIIGAGSMGNEVAKRIKSFGCKVLGIRKKVETKNDFFDSMYYGLDQMVDIIRDADHIVCCLPLTPETKDIFNDAMLENISKESHFYNFGRAEYVDHDSLFARLNRGEIGSATLDLTIPEIIPDGDKIWETKNLTLTQGLSDWSPKKTVLRVKSFEDNFFRFVNNEPLMGSVDLDHLY